jgi:hypothetical protein
MPLDFVDRETALRKNPYFAHAVLSFQATCHPEVDGLFEEGDEVLMDLDAEEAEILTAETADALNRESIADFEAMTDQMTLPDGIGKQVSFDVAAALAGNLQGAVARNGKAWVNLSEIMGWGDTIILPVFTRGLLEQDNDHPPMLRARERLIAMGLEPDFSGGIVASGDEAAALIADLFRVTRYNACAPYIFLAGEHAKTSSVLCKYINFHFDGYDDAETRKLVRAFRKAGLHHFKDGICREPFSSTGAIGGRRIQIG